MALTQQVTGLLVPLQDEGPEKTACKGDVVNVDGEHSLVAIRASRGSADVNMANGKLSSMVGVGTFDIEDLLVGSRCPQHAFLARSSEVVGADC